MFCTSGSGSHKITTPPNSIVSENCSDEVSQSPSDARTISTLNLVWQSISDDNYSACHLLLYCVALEAVLPPNYGMFTLSAHTWFQTRGFRQFSSDYKCLLHGFQSDELVKLFDQKW